MPVFVDAPTAGWDVQANPCGTALAAVLCVARPEGLEPSIVRLEFGCLIQFGYGRGVARIAGTIREAASACPSP